MPLYTSNFQQYTRNPDVILRPLRDVRDHRRGQEENRTAPFLNTKLARPHVRSAYQPVLRAGTWHKDDIVQRSTVQRSTRRASETHSVISNQVPGVFACSRCTVLQALPVCRSGTTCVANSKFPVYSPVAGVPYFRHCMFAGREPLCCGRSVYCSTLIQRRIIVDFGSGGVRDDSPIKFSS